MKKSILYGAFLILLVQMALGFQDFPTYAYSENTYFGSNNNDWLYMSPVVIGVPSPTFIVCSEGLGTTVQPLIENLDNSGGNEIMFLDVDTIQVRDSECQEVASKTLAGTPTGAFYIFDRDVDGLQEMAVLVNDSVYLYEWETSTSNFIYDGAWAIGFAPDEWVCGHKYMADYPYCMFFEEGSYTVTNLNLDTGVLDTTNIGNILDYEYFCDPSSHTSEIGASPYRYNIPVYDFDQDAHEEVFVRMSDDSGCINADYCISVIELDSLDEEDNEEACSFLSNAQKTYMVGQGLWAGQLTGTESTDLEFVSYDNRWGVPDDYVYIYSSSWQTKASFDIDSIALAKTTSYSNWVIGDVDLDGHREACFLYNRCTAGSGGWCNSGYERIVCYSDTYSQEFAVDVKAWNFSLSYIPFFSGEYKLSGTNYSEFGLWDGLYEFNGTGFNQIYDWSSYTGTHGGTFIPVDMNNDGKLDVVYSDSNIYSIFLLNTTPSYCGDGNCDWDENYISCPDDCPLTCTGTCGDGTCDVDYPCDETTVSCPADCVAGEEGEVTYVCGDGTCDTLLGESYRNCPADCDYTATTPIESEVDMALPLQIVNTENVNEGLLPDLYYGIMGLFGKVLKPLVFLLVMIMLLLLSFWLLRTVKSKL